MPAPTDRSRGSGSTVSDGALLPKGVVDKMSVLDKTEMSFTDNCQLAFKRILATKWHFMAVDVPLIRAARALMAASAQAPPPALSAEQAKVVLAEVIKAFGAPENVQRMDEARENACNDMGKMLQFLLPVATQIQQDVIKAYGFSSDGEGVLKFARLIKSYESQDPEIASMSGKLKALFLPPMTLPPHGAGIGGVAAS